MRSSFIRQEDEEKSYVLPDSGVDQKSLMTSLIRFLRKVK